MKVIVYVEGPSDRLSLESLLRELIERKRTEGIGIEFRESPRGNKKLTLLTKVPLKAVDILHADQEAIVVALPDLHPRNVGFDHETWQQLRKGILEEFRRAVGRKKIDDDRLVDRFRVFCLKHDLEALLLAAREELLERLGASKPKVRWKEPVEEQNHGDPPKRIVEKLFAAHGRRYRELFDAPWILVRADYEVIIERCPECFKPFVEFLSGLESASASATAS